MTTVEIIKYYSDLLIIQYIGKPRAYATVQTLASQGILPTITTQNIVFSAVPASGAFKLSYDGTLTASIAWNDSAATIQTDLQAISGLGSVTVTGSIASQTLTVTFVGVPPPSDLLIVSDNTLEDSGSHDIDISVPETDVTLPIAVQDAFDLLGTDTAIGVQLDVIGKYVGVTRSGVGFGGNNITLDDSDFLSLIRMAIIRNTSDASLQSIVNLLETAFPDQILVFDYLNMRLSYLINSSIGSLDLIQLFITEGLLPKPTGVELAITIIGPDITDFFGFRTYDLPAIKVNPFNTYDDYHTNWPWLSYSDGLGV